MLPKEIKSLQHPIVKEFVQLRTKKQYREEKRRALIIGYKMVKDLLPLGIISKILLKKNQSLPSFFSKNQEFISVTEEILEKITQLKNNEGIVAEVCIPEMTSLKDKKLILALDQVQDPGNVGTLIRSAVAFGFDGVYLLDGTCDPYNEKALRAAKGATFFIPLEKIDQKTFLERSKDSTLLIGDLDGDSVQNACKSEITSPLILLLGNEGNGPSISKESGKKVTIAMQSIDSLNVAVAGSILMHQIKEIHG